jgi:hypothetical protein
MFRRWAWGLLPLSFAALNGAAVAADRTDPGQAAFARFHGGPPTNPPAEKPVPKVASDRKPTETNAAVLAQEQANLLRRIAVCDRLRQLALELGDTKLEAEADRLEERANEVYRLRTRKLTDSPAEQGVKR